MLILATAALTSCVGLVPNEDSSAVTSEASTNLTSEDTSTTGSTSSSSSKSTGGTVTSQTGSTTGGEESSHTVGERSYEDIIPDTATDWSEATKDIFRQNLDGHVPPFFKTRDMVFYVDALDYLTFDSDVTSSNILIDYMNLLDANGYQTTASYDYANRVHLYGRYRTTNGFVEIDAMVTNLGRFNVIFGYSPVSSEWPVDSINYVFTEYGTNATLPQPVGATGFVFGVSNWYDMSILCLGDIITAASVASYAELLTTYKWVVAESTDPEYAGLWSGHSLDNLATIEFYWDGTGLQVNLSHGDGEIYTSWDDCVPAINAFIADELELANPSSTVPALTTASRYEIGRGANGWLYIDCYKDLQRFTQADQRTYEGLLTGAGFVYVKMVNNAVYYRAANSDYGVSVEVYDSTTDDGDDNDFLRVGITSMRGIEGYYLAYSWPVAQVSAVASRYGVTEIPAFANDGAMFYHKWNTDRSILYVDIEKAGENALSDYRYTLETLWDYQIVDANDNGYKAIDPDHKIQIEVTLNNGALCLVISGYVAPMSNGTIDFSSTSQIDASNSEQVSYSYITWGGSPYAFRVETNTSTVSVGNYGDYLSYKGALRIYQGQKIILTPENGKTFVSITVNTTAAIKSNGSTDTSFTDANFVSSIASVAGVTETTPVGAPSGKHVFTISGEAAHGFEFVVTGKFALAKVVATLA